MVQYFDTVYVKLRICDCVEYPCREYQSPLIEFSVFQAEIGRSLLSKRSCEPGL